MLYEVRHPRLSASRRLAFRLLAVPLAAGLMLPSAVFWAPAANGSTIAPGGFVSVGPTRVLDTRTSIGGAPGPVSAGGIVHLSIGGRAGVPSAGVTAVVLNVTVTQTATAGYVTVFPHGGPAPLASSLNYVAGLTVANSVIVQLGAGGAVDMYNGSAGGAVSMIADLVGYYTGGQAVAGGLTPLPPTRLLDTRASAPVPSYGVVPLTVTGRAGVPPTGVSAVVLNVTVTQPQAAGYITAYPGGGNIPLSSNLNFVTNQTVPNLVIVPVGAGGVVDLLNGSLASVHLVADISGYFLGGASVGPGTFVPATPNRILDTRDGTGTNADRATAARTSIKLPLPMWAVSGHSLTAAVLNVTAIAPYGPGYVTAYPDGASIPDSSNVNFAAGQVVPNLVIVPIGADGAIDLQNGSLLGAVDLVADVLGYFSDGTLGAVSGTVRNAAGAPLAGVPAVVTIDQGYGAPPLEWRSVTDQDGHYAIVGLPVGMRAPCFLGTVPIAGAPPTGYQTVCYSGSPSAWVGSGAATTGLDAVMPEGSSISGRLTQNGGIGLAGLTVRIVAATGNAGHGSDPVITAADGSYSIDGLQAAPAGSYALCSEGGNTAADSRPLAGFAAGCVTISQELPAGGSLTGVDFTPIREVGASGDVTATSGGPIVDALVVVTAGNLSDYHTGYGYTDRQGHYVVGRISVLSSNQTGGPIPGWDIHVCVYATGDPTGMGGGRQAYGSVPDAAYVNTCYGGSQAGDFGAASTPGGVALQVPSAGNVKMPTEAVVLGTVYGPSGGPESGVGVRVGWPSDIYNSPHSAVTGGDGTYRVSLPATSVAVCFAPPAGVTASYVRQCAGSGPTGLGDPTVFALPDDSVTRVDIHLVVGGTVTGIVTDAIGTPLNGVHVTVRNSVLTESAVGTSGTDGRFIVANAPFGLDDVCFDFSAVINPPSARGYQNECWASHVPGPDYGDPFVIGQSGVPVAISFAATEAPEIDVLITDSAGTPLAGANVEVNPAGDRSHTVSGVTAADGTFVALGLTSGAYNVCATAGAASGGSSSIGYLPTCYKVDPGAAPYSFDDYIFYGGDILHPVGVTQANVVMQSSSGLSGRVLNSSGAPVHTEVHLVPAGSSNSSRLIETAIDGTFSDALLVPGSYTICVGDPTIAGSVCYPGDTTGPNAVPSVLPSGALLTGVNITVPA